MSPTPQQTMLGWPKTLKDEVTSCTGGAASANARTCDIDEVDEVTPVWSSDNTVDCAKEASVGGDSGTDVADKRTFVDWRSARQ